MMRTPVAIALLPALLLTACGEDEPAAPEAGPPVTLTGTTNDHGAKDVSGSGTDATLDVELDDFYFGPTFIKTVNGAMVKLMLKNAGENVHTFTVEGGLDETLQPGGAKMVVVSVPAGPVVFYCRFHREGGMQGALYTVAGQRGGVNPSSSPATSESPDRY